MIVTKIQELIGQTPFFVFDNQSYPMPKETKIYAKLEYLNPGGSIKDRLGYHLVREAIAKKQITKETTIIEPTAGNTGIGLALAALEFDLPVIFVVPEKFSIEKQQIMQALGAQIVHTPTELGIAGAIEKAKEMLKGYPNAYVPNQFANAENPSAYEQSLGPEIFNELGGSITSIVAGIGSGGTLVGTAKYLQEKIPNLRVIGVEPEGSILNGGPSHGHKIEGIGVEFIPPFLEEIGVDIFDTISDEVGFSYTRSLARNQGLLVGSSSGAAFASALLEAQRLPAGSTIVTIFPDAGDRYLSKNIYKK